MEGPSSPVSYTGSAPAYMAIVVSGAAVLIPLLSFSVISEFSVGFSLSLSLAALYRDDGSLSNGQFHDLGRITTLSCHVS
jgi:hypothetical protein